MPDIIVVVINMTMKKRRSDKQNEVILLTMEDVVPSDHIVRKMERHLDLTFVYKEVKHLYSKVGNHSIDPVVFFKILLIRYMFGIKSMRETMRQIEVNVAYRWYLDIPFSDPIPHHSTISKTYYRKFKDSDIFEKIFTHILELAERNGYVDYEEVFVDATHIKAYANKKKFNEVQKLVSTVIKTELNEEVNQLRKKLGKKPIELDDFVESQENETSVSDDDSDEGSGFSSSGQGKKVIKVETKRVKQSLNDPEAGYYYRDEKEKGFMYQDHRMVCGKHNFIVGSVLLSGNIHDSKALQSLMNQVEGKFKKNFKSIALDSGYHSLEIMHTLSEKNKYSVIAYRRFGKKSKDGSFYDKEQDWFVCQEGCVFPLKNVDKSGYKQYFDSQNCASCPTRCYAKSETKKVFRRHLWADKQEENRERRISEKGRLLYKKRSETIERSFADSKQNHGLRWTNYKGKKTNQHYNWMLCSAQNLKKLCKLKSIEYADSIKEVEELSFLSLIQQFFTWNTLIFNYS